MRHELSLHIGSEILSLFGGYSCLGFRSKPRQIGGKQIIEAADDNGGKTARIQCAIHARILKIERQNLETRKLSVNRNMTQQILVRENMKRGRAMLTPTALSFEQSVVLAALHNHSYLIDRYTE